MDVKHALVLRHSLETQKKRKKGEGEEEEEADIAMILFQQVTLYRISRLFAKHIKPIHIPVKKNAHMLRPIKDKFGLKVAGICCVPCECSKVCIGQTGRSIKTRCKEHMRYICLDHTEESVMAEHKL
jgi:hypothetical protein